MTERRIQLKGKYMEVVEKWVQSLDFGARRLFAINDECHALVNAITKLHRDYIDRDTAISLLADECFQFKREKGLIAGEMLQDRAEARAELITRIKRLIESYPRKYVLRIELPSFPSYGRKTVELSNDVRIQVQAPPTPIEPDLQILFDAHQIAQKEAPLACLEIDAEGYGDDSVESPAVAAALSTAKQCLFILESHEVLTPSYFQTLDADALLVDTTNSARTCVGVPQAWSRHVGRLIPNEDKLQLWEAGQTVLTGMRRSPATAEEKLLALDDAMAPLTRYLRARGHDDFQSVAAAIEWHQDSRHSEDQTFSYLAACIGLEAILGSDDHLQEMSTRLVDRYAFRMGRGRADRSALAKQYADVLNLRGKLVHAKVTRLRSSADRTQLHTVQKMLHGLIWQELGDLYKSKPKT